MWPKISQRDLLSFMSAGPGELEAIAADAETKAGVLRG